MANALTLLKDFCTFYFVERDGKKALSLLTNDITWFGTSDFEDVVSIQDAENYFRAEMQVMPHPYKMKISGENYISTGPSTGVAFLRVVLETEGVSESVRITAASRLDEGVEKLCSMHFSVSDSAQLQDEFFPITKQKQTLARAKAELVMSTIEGGLLGGYVQNGFPFYFVSQRMLEYLGYADEKEFIDDIDGLIINGVHPDDRDSVSRKTMIQLSHDSQYAVDYRMKKKDGSYIWVHDIGRKTLNENDEEVIISVCYDVTEKHEKQAQLDNLMNAVPGGVALYRMVDGDFQLLYHSRGVSALSGRSPEQYEALMQNGIKNSIFPEDVDMVFAALNRALESDESVSIDYRVSHINGGHIWVSSSFKQTSVENGHPIIHAVFTEMPQQRELMNSLTENSGTAIVVSDNVTHELLYINSAVRSMLQKNDADYAGKICYKYLLGLDSPCLFCKKPHLSENSETVEELYVPQLDKYFLSQGRLTKWGSREAHIEYLTDITETKKAQAQLNEMVQSISCGMVVSKASTVDGSYEIQYMNKGFCQLFEGTEAELRERYKSDIYVGVHPEDFGKVREMSKQLMQSRSHTDGTLRFILPNGRTKWIRLDVNAVTLPDDTATTYATYYDVTTQVQQEQQLHDVVHNVPGGICLYRWDGIKIHPIVVSEQFSAILGEDARASLEQTSGMMYKHVHPDDLPALQQAMLKALQQNQKFEHTYRSFNVKTNLYRWIYAQGTVVSQDDGSQLAYVCYTDITDEHLMGQKLLASERALDAATEHAGLWYWKYDPVNGIAYFNTKCMRDFNLPETLENYPQAWFDRNFLLPEYIPVYADSVRKIQQGEPQVVFEAQVKFKDSSIHWAEFRFTNLLSEDGNASIAVCTAHLIDVEKELLAKYEFERQKPSLGEKDLLIHATFNLDTGETLDYNYTSRLGKPEQRYKTIEESISTIAESIIDPDAKEKFVLLNNVEYLKTQIQLSNVDFSMDYRRRMPDKQIIWVRNIFHLVREPSTGAVLLFEYCYNIHEQKMAEEVLYSVTTYDYEQIASVNFNIGKMMYYGSSNQSFEERMVDYHTMRQHYAQQIVLPEEQQRFLENTEPQTVRERASATGYFDFTTKVVRDGNVPGIIKTRFVPYDIDNDIYIMTKTDVTSLLMEEETKNCRLREALDIARQANSAKTDFLSAMSHDIRTPMNAIVGMCELALDDEHNQNQVHESLKAIQSSSRLLLSLINNILDVSRIESGKMVMMNEPFSLSQQINETIQSYMALAAQKSQQFKSYVSIIHDACYGDVARIHSAVDNILANAIKYTPAGGTIVYRVSEEHSDKPGIGLFRFEISDTGIGISPEKQKRLFEPFYRGETDLTAKVEGTGLGLSITKAIVDLKGGTISVDSAVDVGTTFVIELPMQFASADIVPSKEPGGESAKDYDLSGLRILLCEDHPINQRVIKKILEKANAAVVVADDGNAGYNTFLQSAQGELDLILMDIQMPIMNGHEATRAIRQSGHPQAKTIPIIALSANAFSEDVQRSTLAGMNAHLPKPIVPGELYKCVLHFTKGEDR